MATSKYQLSVDNKHQLTIAQPLWHSQPMVDKNELRAAFSSRLHEALNDAGVRSRGRGVDIQKQLKSVGVNKTTQAISKWLNGEAMAEADSMVALSAWLKVRREWLEYGVLPKIVASNEDRQPSLHLGRSNASPSSERFGKVPLISWDQAGASSGAAWGSKPDAADTWLSCPVGISDSGYALIVRGDSMTNSAPGRSYPPGCIIFVDPDVEAANGDRVVARVPGTKEVTFKQLVRDAGRQFLKPINQQYPMIDITDQSIICGKVVASFFPE